jgi:hypothetical protein
MGPNPISGMLLFLRLVRLASLLLNLTEGRLEVDVLASRSAGLEMLIPSVCSPPRVDGPCVVEGVGFLVTGQS